MESDTEENPKIGKKAGWFDSKATPKCKWCDKGAPMGQKYCSPECESQRIEFDQKLKDSIRRQKISRIKHASFDPRRCGWCEENVYEGQDYPSQEYCSLKCENDKIAWDEKQSQEKERQSRIEQSRASMSTEQAYVKAQEQGRQFGVKITGGKSRYNDREFFIYVPFIRDKENRILLQESLKDIGWEYFSDSVLQGYNDPRPAKYFWRGYETEKR